MTDRQNSNVTASGAVETHFLGITYDGNHTECSRNRAAARGSAAGFEGLYTALD